MDYTKSNALYTTVPIINNAYLGIIKIPFPEVKEQNEIISYLDKKCSQIDTIVKDKQEQLEKIKQHKKSLIYEYVTGKKRVKEATNGN
jgi:type I restriction enzyme S subunit